MAVAVTYEKAHLVVAAIRVLAHTTGRSPDEDEVAALLHWPPEAARTAVRHLAEDGILAVIRTPFEARIEVADHLRIDDLPRESDEPTMSTEVKEFLGAKKGKQAGLETMFGGDVLSQKSRARQAELDAQLKAFRSKSPGPPGDDDD